MLMELFIVTKNRSVVPAAGFTARAHDFLDSRTVEWWLMVFHLQEGAFLHRRVVLQAPGISVGHIPGVCTGL